MFHTEGNYPLKIFVYKGSKGFNFLQVSWTHSSQMLWPKMRCTFLFYRAALKLGWFILTGQDEAIYPIH